MADALDADVTCQGDGDVDRGPETGQAASGIFFGGTPDVPDRIGPYAIVETLGEGGFGIVYLARQSAPVQRDVAIKIIKPGMDSREIITRFDAERQAMAMMSHPGVARILDAGATERGRPYFVMEYVRGTPITTYCNQNQLSVRRRLELFVKVCEAVQHAHERGILHRDLKPANILVTDDGGDATPRVIDFGVAKALHQPLTDAAIHTRQNQMIGTPEYMAPEQASVDARDVDVRADVYALGVVLYEMLVGALPFDRNAFRSKSLADIQQMIQQSEPPSAARRLTTLDASECTLIARQRSTQLEQLRRELRRELEYIPAKAMRKDRTRRYRSAIDLADDIRAYLEGRAIEAHPESRVYLASKFVRRHRVPVGFSAAIVVLLVAATVMSGSLWMKANHEASIAERRSAAMEAFAEALTESGIAGEANIDERLHEVADKILPILANDPVGEAEVRLKIGRALYQAGELPASEAHLTRARDLFAEHRGEDSLEYEASLYRLGYLRDKQGRYQDAMDLYSRCLEIVDSHPDAPKLRRATVLHGLGLARLHADHPEARATLEESFRIAAEAERPEIAAHSMVQLAELDRVAGEYAAAEQRLKDVLDAWTTAYGPEDARLGSVYSRMALVYNDWERDEPAIEALDQALALQESLDRDHPRVGRTHVTAGMVHLRAAERANDEASMFVHLEHAEAHLAEGVRIYRLRYGERHHFYAGALLSWGDIQRARGDWDHAIESHQSALDIYHARKASELTIAIARSRLGESLMAGGRFPESESHLRDAYDIVSETNTKLARRIAANLASVYRALERTEEARTWERLARGE